MGDPAAAAAARMTGTVAGAPSQQQFLPAFPSAIGTPGRQPLPKQLTAAIKSCSSLDRLAQLFHAHQMVLNPIHIAAMITKLPKLDTSMHNAAVTAGADLPWMLSTTSAQQGQLRQLLQQLLMRLKMHGCGEYSPRGVANIVWALAKLQCAPDPELRNMLLDKFCSQLDAAVPQDISNVLWGVAKLTKERTAVLTNSMPGLSSLGRGSQGSLGSLAPGLPSASSPSTTSSPGLSSSNLSGHEWMLMGLSGSSGAAPDPAAAALTACSSTPLLLQEQVRLLLQHLCQQLHNASVQTISNSLWAVVVLQQEHQWCMCNCLAEVQSLLSAFCEQPHQALPGHIQPVIRCMSQLATTCSNHAGDSWIRWQPPLLQRLLNYLCSQREHMEMHHVSSVLRDVAQVVCLHLLLAKQMRDQQQQQQQGTAAAAAAAGGGGEDACLPAASRPAGASACSSSTSSSPVLGGSTGPARAGSGGCTVVPSLNTISVEDESEEVLARLAATGGPQDASSTVVALAMLRPQLETLGLQQGVAGLCSLLPPAALPQLGTEVGQQLLAATSCTTPMTATQPAAAWGTSGDAPGGMVLSVPMSPSGIQRVFAAQHPQTALLLPMVSALPGSSSSCSCSNSSNSNLCLDGGLLEGGGGVAGAGSGSSTGGSGEPLPQVHLPQSPQLAPAAAASPPPLVVGGGVMPTATDPAALLATRDVSAAATAFDSQQQQQQQQQQGAAQVAAAGLYGPGQAAGCADTGAGSVEAAAAAMQAVSSPPAPAAGLHVTSPMTALSAAIVAPPSDTPTTTTTTSSSSSTPLQSAPPPAAAVAVAAEGPRGAGELAAGLDSQQEAAARQLTHNIAYADSVYQLAEIFTAHSSVMDMIHITACITRLSKVLGTAPSPAAQAAAASLLPLLGAKLLEVLPHANARGIANVLWGYGRLRNLQQADLLPGLIEAFLKQLPAAACRDSAVVLWSLARLVEGQDIASVGLQVPLLQRLGSVVLEQLATAATAAMSAPPQQQALAAAAAGGAGSSSAAAAVGLQQQEHASAPSSRDISNSLMALTRLGFLPETSSSSLDAAAAAEQQQQQPSAADAAAQQLTGLSLQPQGDLAANTAGSLGPRPQEPAAGTAAEGEQHHLRQQAAAAAGPQVTQLTLSVRHIEVVVKFLLQQAHTAKTLDLQEAATALKQLGLNDLHALVAAAIAAHHGAPPPPPGHGSGAHGGGLHFVQQQQQQQQHVPGLHQQHQHEGLLQPSFHLAQHGAGLFGRPQQQPQQHMGPAGGQAGVLGLPASINLSGTQLAGLLQQQRRQQPLPVSGPAYGAGWLEGGGAAGSAGGAGGPGGAAESVRLRAAAAGVALPTVSGGIRVASSNTHMQQQYQQYLQSTAGRRPQQQLLMTGGDMASFAGMGGDYGLQQQAQQQQQQQPPPPPEQPQWGVSPTQQQQQQLAQLRAMAAGGVMRFQQGRSSSGTGGGLPPHQPQFAHHHQQQQQQQPPEQPQWGVSPTQQQQQQLAQLRAMARSQQQQMIVAGSNPGSPGAGMQYVQIPPQQPQQPQHAFVLQHQQPQPQMDVMSMQQMLQQQQPQQQAQQAGAVPQQYIIIPASSTSSAALMTVAGSSYNLGQQGLAAAPASADWQQQQQGQQQQQQQSGQQILLLPQQLQAASGRQGQFAAAPQFPGSAGMVLGAPDLGGMLDLSGSNPAPGPQQQLQQQLQQQQQMQQMLQMLPGAVQFQQQQQQRPPQPAAPAALNQEPPGLFVQQEQGLQTQQQQQQQLVYGQYAVSAGPVGSGLTFDPATGGFYQGGQFQQ